MSPAGPLTVLFDLDDTLVAFEAVSEQSWLEVCLEYERRGRRLGAAELAAAIREHARSYWSDPERHRWGRAHMLEARRSIVSETFASLGLPAHDAVGLADSYSVVRLARMHALDGAHETLRLLRHHGCRLGLVTNGDGPGQREKIDRFALAGYFEVILVEGEVGFGKPDARVYHRALAELRCSPDETRMVGDNLVWDVDAPQRMGILSVWVDRIGTGLPAGCATLPWRIVRTVAELPRALGLAARGKHPGLTTPDAADRLGRPQGEKA